MRRLRRLLYRSASRRHLLSKAGRRFRWCSRSPRRSGRTSRSAVQEMARVQAVALKQAAPVRTMVARVLGVHTDERAWRIGADGEQKVAGQLAKLAKKDPVGTTCTRSQ